MGRFLVAVVLTWSALSLLLATADPNALAIVGACVVFGLGPFGLFGFSEWLGGTKHVGTRPPLQVELTRHTLLVGRRRIALEDIRAVHRQDTPPYFELELRNERLRLPDGYELDVREARSLLEDLAQRTQVLARAEERGVERARIQALTAR